MVLMKHLDLDRQQVLRRQQEKNLFVSGLVQKYQEFHREQVLDPV